MKEVEGYINTIEEVLKLGKGKDFSKGILNGCTEIKDILSEISSMIQSEKDVKRLEKDVSKLIDSLVSHCEKGDQTATLGTMRQLRDKVRYFRYYISKQEKGE